jgi:hypothetical protein
MTILLFYCPMLFSVADHRSFKRMSREEEPT